MTLLKKAENTLAFGKIGILGFQGAGKTFTAMQIAAGIHKMIGSTKPIAFMDTETGSDFFIKKLAADGIELWVAKTRAFKDALSIFGEAQGACDILVVDSVSHVWRDLCESYQKRMNRNRLRFQDWAILKGEWGRFTDLFVNAPVHTIIAGRAGYEYDYKDDGDGKLELTKTGTKMKAETEFGYEPSLLIEMVRIKKSSLSGDINDKGWLHRAHILKDRTDTLDGEEFDDPSFEVFVPHFEGLNIGGEHLGVNTERDSTDIFTEDGDSERAKYARERDSIYEEIKARIDKEWAGQAADAKKRRLDVFEEIFGHLSETRAKHTPLKELRGIHYNLVLIINKEREKHSIKQLPLPDYEEFKPAQEAA